MNYKFILASMLIFFSLVAYGQNNLNKMINLPDSISSKLAHFLQRSEKLDTLYNSIYVYRVTPSSSIKYTDDVYQFRLMGPHFRMRVFINNHGQIKIFENTSIEGLLKEFYDFILNSNITEKKKIEYLNAIALFLKDNYDE